MPEPIRRTTARVVPVNRDGEVLVLYGCDPLLPRRPTGSPSAARPSRGDPRGDRRPRAARGDRHRRCSAAAGRALPPGPRRQFSWNGMDIDNDSHFFAVRVDEVEVSFDGLDDLEAGSIWDARWWLARRGAQGRAGPLRARRGRWPARSWRWPRETNEGTLWGGRFAGGPSPELEALSRSTHFDWRLVPYDLAGSVAHANALHRAGLLTEADHESLLGGLAALSRRTTRGRCTRTPSDEDVHGALERLLIEQVGPDTGGTTARRTQSRNDQVATLFKAYLRDQARAVSALLLDLVEVLSARPATTSTWSCPGRTHLQHAQPVLLVPPSPGPRLAAAARRRAAARLGCSRRRRLAVRLRRPRRHPASASTRGRSPTSSASPTPVPTPSTARRRATSWRSSPSWPR